MNKKRFAILSFGNISNKDEGMALYASKYIEDNYSFTPSVDIIHGGVDGMNLLNTLMQYEEVIILDVVGIDDTPGSIYHFPMQEFRNLGSNESDEMDVLGCLNLLESRSERLPDVSLLAIVPDALEGGRGLSPILTHSMEAYVLNIVKTIEKRGFSYEEKEDKDELNKVIESFIERDFA